MKEGKTPAPEPQRPSADILTKQLPAGLLGLEIPPDVRDVLKVGERLKFYVCHHCFCLSNCPESITLRE